MEGSVTRLLELDPAKLMTAASTAGARWRDREWTLFATLRILSVICLLGCHRGTDTTKTSNIFDLAATHNDQTDNERLTNRSPVQTEDMASDPTLQVHDAGMAMAGQRVVHVFKFRNPTNCVIRINDEQTDVETSCGCTHADVADHQLQPGQSTTVSMEVNTANKQGPLAEHTTIRWTMDNGTRGRMQPIVASFAIHVQLRTPIAFSPPELFFSRQDVASSTVHEVTCQPDQQIDWKRVVFECSHPYLRIVSRQKNSDGSLRLGIVCDATDQGVGRRAELRLLLPTEVNSNPPPRTATLIVSSHDPAALRAAPGCVLFRPLGRADTSSRDRFQANVILRGDALAKETLAKIDCDQLDIQFQADRIASTAVRVRIVGTLIRSFDTSATGGGDSASGTICVTLQSGIQTEVPFRLPRPSEDIHDPADQSIGLPAESGATSTCET